MSYQPAHPDDWKGRTSSSQDYLYQRVQCLNLEQLDKCTETTVGLLGYAVDEGVRRNQGRIGALEGPASFKASFSKLADHFSEQFKLLDLGSIYCDKQQLEATQEELSNAVYKLLSNGCKPLLIGGGHDIAYGHFKGLQKAYPDHRIGIVNFDAHLDLRSFDHGAHSGSPFNQIASEVNSFKYCCIGFREEANPPSLLKRAHELNVTLIDRKDSHINAIDEVKTILDGFTKAVDLLYITIDLDGFAAAYAPGVSAPSPMGIDVDFGLSCLDHLFSSNKVISVDIAELNPKYDLDSRTSKLAASLAYHILKQWI